MQGTKHPNIFDRIGVMSPITVGWVEYYEKPSKSKWEIRRDAIVRKAKRGKRAIRILLFFPVAALVLFLLAIPCGYIIYLYQEPVNVVVWTYCWCMSSYLSAMILWDKMVPDTDWISFRHRKKEY